MFCPILGPDFKRTLAEKGIDIEAFEEGIRQMFDVPHFEGILAGETNESFGDRLKRESEGGYGE